MKTKSGISMLPAIPEDGISMLPAIPEDGISMLLAIPEGGMWFNINAVVHCSSL